jgi:hypothetical protein
MSHKNSSSLQGIHFIKQVREMNFIPFKDT